MEQLSKIVFRERNNNSFIADYVHITTTIEQHKENIKWLALARFRIGVCTQPTLK